jgi:hypothetical protein
MNAAFTVQIEIMLRILLSFLFIFAPFYSQANEPGGSVCLGKNLSVVWDEHTERLHITIGDSPKIYFNIPRNSPRIVAKDLDKNANHTVKVYFDGHGELEEHGAWNQCKIEIASEDEKRISTHDVSTRTSQAGEWWCPALNRGIDHGLCWECCLADGDGPLDTYCESFPLPFSCNCAKPVSML